MVIETVLIKHISKRLKIRKNKRKTKKIGCCFMLNLHLRMRTLHSLLQVFQRTKFESNTSRLPLVSKIETFKSKSWTGVSCVKF